MSAFAASLGLAAAVAQHGLTGHEPFVGAPLLGAAVLLRPCASLSILTALRSRGPGLPFRCRFLRCHSFVRPAGANATGRRSIPGGQWGQYTPPVRCTLAV